MKNLLHKQVQTAKTFMFDLSALQYNSENPTVLSVLLTVLFSFLLSSLIAFTYDKTSRGVYKPLHYLQTLILISLVAATVMQAIGDSLARGLGMLGALAIIRFRTTLRDPRNMAFMFSSLAVGISCGVGGFVIATVGTISFCLVAFLLRLTPYSSPNNLVGNLRFELIHESIERKEAQQIIDRFCSSRVLISQKVAAVDGKKGTRSEYVYQVRLRNIDAGLEFVQALEEMEALKKVNLDIKDMPDNV